MTDRIRSLSVALEDDIRDDDIKPLVEAIKQIRGVLNVEKNIALPNDWCTEDRVRREFKEKLWDVLG